MYETFSKISSLELREGKWRAILAADFLSEMEDMVLVESRPFMIGWVFLVILVNINNKETL